MNSFSIRVRVAPSVPPVCRTRRLTRAVLPVTPQNRGPGSQQVWHHKDSFLFISIQQWSQLFRPSQPIVRSPFQKKKTKTIERNAKQYIEKKKSISIHLNISLNVSQTLISTFAWLSGKKIINMLKSVFPLTSSLCTIKVWIGQS